MENNLQIIDKLGAPSAYWRMSELEKVCVCNGCGPGKLGSKFVPDRLHWIGVDFTEACNIHDFCYYTQMPKKEADNLFLDNMSVEADNAYWGCRWIAHRCAFIYYLAVKWGGQAAYDKGD